MKPVLPRSLARPEHAAWVLKDRAGTATTNWRQQSCLQLVFELVQKTPIGVVGDQLIGK